MTMSFGDDDHLQSATLRGRNWPTLRQFAVFLENRVGQLHDLLRQLERHDLRIVALSIHDSVDYAVARIIMSNYERGLELLKFSNLPVFETDVIGVELPDAEQPHVSICTAVMRAEVNIHYTYPLLYRRNGRGAIAMYVDDIDETLRVLDEQGQQLVTEADLLDDDEFFA